MGRELTVGSKILELFKTHKELRASQICKLMPGHDEAKLKSAIRRLRGESGSKQKHLRAARYIQQSGHGGSPEPVLVLGTGADAPKEEAYVMNNDEAIKRSSALRAKRHEHQLARELAELDSYG
jgi:hypothetical protein